MGIMILFQSRELVRDPVKVFAATIPNTRYNCFSFIKQAEKNGYLSIISEHQRSETNLGFIKTEKGLSEPDNPLFQI